MIESARSIRLYWLAIARSFRILSAGNLKSPSSGALVTRSITRGLR